jgi:hypothetical protein
MSLTTPDTIRTLQRKLYAKAKQEPAYRFYALYDKISREDILSHAWRLVRSNRGSPGIDGISFEAENGIGVETFLRDLARDLKDKTYRAHPEARHDSQSGWQSAPAGDTDAPRSCRTNGVSVQRPHLWRSRITLDCLAGIDGISFEAIENGIGVETFLRGPGPVI